MPTLTFGKPQPKQEEFMRAKALFVAYGGARGGGKSWALRMKLIRMCLKHAGLSCLILRRTFPEVYENQVQYIEQDLDPLISAKGSVRVKHDHTNHVFTFPNGSRIKYGYCACEKDAQQYQGQSYDVIGLDEATHFTEAVFNMLTPCIRGNENLPKRMYLTCNPGGVGHEWVKRLFIDKQYKEGEVAEDYVFISAKYTDNRYNGPQYAKMLNSLTEDLRRAWRDGEWDVFVGQYFPEWDESAISVDRFTVPQAWITTLSIDYGLDCFAPIWYATNENGTSYIIKGAEIKNCLVSDAAKFIKQTEIELGIADRRIRRLAPPDLWHRTGQTGRSTIDMFCENGIVFSKSDNNREAGWMAIKEMLEDGSLRMFRGAAPELNRCMRLLQYDDKKANDVCNEPHDITHSPDSLRYYCIMRKQSARVKAKAHKENYFTHDIEPKKQYRKVSIKPKVFVGGWNG